MTDVAKLNEMAVSRMAAEMLRSVGEEPDPNRFHCVQLILWHVTVSSMELEASLLETLQAMISWRPQRMMNFLGICLGEEWKPVGWRESKSAAELAAILLRDVEHRMFATFPWYGHLE